MIRRFFLAFAASALSIVIPVMALNVLVDPYGIHSNSMGLNFAGSERVFKIFAVRRVPHGGLLLGSSRMSYVDPAIISGARLFNSAFSQASLVEILTYLQRWAGQPDFVIIGLDFYMMNESEDVPGYVSVLDKSVMSIMVDHALSWEAAHRSAEALIARAHGERPALQANGARDAMVRNAEKALLPAEGQADEYRESINWPARSAYLRYRYTPSRIKILRQIAQHLEDTKIRYAVVLGPVNQEFKKTAIDANGLSDTFERWRRDMRDIFPDLYDFSYTYTDPSYFFPYDAGHFTPETGKLIIEPILAAAITAR